MRRKQTGSSGIVLLLSIGILLSGILFAREKNALAQEARVNTAEKQLESGIQKNHFKYVLLSLVVPGAGEWAMGKKQLGKFFFGAELLLWTGFLGSRSYIGILQNDLEAHAALHAGVNTAGKNDQYWIDIGEYKHIEAYNARRLIQRKIDQMYPLEKGYEWRWDSQDNREIYLEQRFGRESWKRRARTLLGTILLNHLVSAVDVIRLTRKDEKSLDQPQQSYLFIDCSNDLVQGEMIRFHFRYAF